VVKTSALDAETPPEAIFTRGSRGGLALEGGAPRGSNIKSGALVFWANLPDVLNALPYSLLDPRESYLLLFLSRQRTNVFTEQKKGVGKYRGFFASGKSKPVCREKKGEGAARSRLAKPWAVLLTHAPLGLGRGSGRRKDGDHIGLKKEDRGPGGDLQKEHDGEQGVLTVEHRGVRSLRAKTIVQRSSERGAKTRGAAGNRRRNSNSLVRANFPQRGRGHQWLTLSRNCFATIRAGESATPLCVERSLSM